VRNNTTIAALMKMNDLKNPSLVKIGSTIKVPASAEAEDEKEARASKTRAEKRTAKRSDGDAETQIAGSQAKPKTSYYVVKKGDTLEKIALRHGTTIPALMKLNKMKKGDHIEAGRRIRVAAGPESEAQAAADEKQGKPEAKSKKKVKGASYVVKKGDTMEKIAAAHNTTLAALLKLNDMKMKEPLLAGKTIKVPPAEE